MFNPNNYHSISKQKIFSLLNTSINGLTPIEVKRRLKKYGPNELKRKEELSKLKLFLSQFANPFIAILFAAIIISIIIHEYINAIVIGSIVILNAILGFVQEYRAEKALDMLKRMAHPYAKVIRNNKLGKIDSSELTIGDIIFFETGDKIPADARIIECHNLELIESSLTGESQPVIKEETIVQEKTILAERKNMVYMTTIVTKGHGKAIVTQIGMNTEIGKIATLIEKTTAELTPFQKKLDKFGKYISLGISILAIVIFLTGIFTGKTLSLMLITAIALAVAAIPEGLPAIITISLALGVQRMIKQHVLIRRLPAVETLGSINVICTDKTGTLTCNEMTVTKIFTNNKEYEVTGTGYKSIGSFYHQKNKINPEEISQILKIGVLCNNTILTQNKTTNKSTPTKESKEPYIGDPTEAAILISALKGNFKQQLLQHQEPRIDEISFTSNRKMMTTFHKIHSTSSKNSYSITSYTKGSAEIIIQNCNRILINNKVYPLTKKDKKQLIAQNNLLAQNALRVLAFAYNQPKKASESAEKNMIFVGLQGMQDPPRESVKESIQKCYEAGIRVIMITGDNLLTAKAIAKELNIQGKYITGAELNKINLDKEIDKINIFARVNPEDKLKIVEALQKKKYHVAMTGDGVNDAPALKRADIGIAMGICGTDVAKEASDMILLDDNFTSIVKAIEEGRAIFTNIKTFLLYLFSGNLGELLAIFTAIIIGFPLPLLAIQILWINVVTETIPAIAVSVEAPQPGIMKQSPKPTKEEIVTKQDGLWILLTSILIMTGTLLAFYGTLFLNNLTLSKTITNTPTYNYALTMAFTTFFMFQFFNIFNSKLRNKTIFSKELFTNKWIYIALGITFILQIMILYIPFFNKIFSTVPLNINDWVIVLAISSSIIWLNEIIKLLNRR